MLVIGKLLGKRKPLFDDWSVPPPEDMGDGDDYTLRHLIEHLVRHEVRKFEGRQEQNQFIRALSQAEIQAAAKLGRVQMGGTDVPVQKIDVEQAINTAWVAFEDGLFLAVIDEQQVKSLDQTICLHEDSRITFIRLTMLTGR